MESLQKLPFISISRENLMAANDLLDREQKGELMEMLINEVLNDNQPTTENRYVNCVFQQFMSVVRRNAESYFKKIKGLEKYNDKRQKAQSLKPDNNTSQKEFNYATRHKEWDC